MNIRTMELTDYDQVYKLWSGIDGFGIRTVDDSKEGVEKFIKRNPGISVVAEDAGEIIGSILGGHDGRRGFLYHVCVAKKYRNHGVGRKMAAEVCKRLKEDGISGINLIAFQSNEVGNEFWKNEGWKLREDLNFYDFNLNEDNRTHFVRKMEEKHEFKENQG